MNVAKPANLTKKVALIVGGIVALLSGFLTYSGAVTFSNWPWTKTMSYTSGGVLGFSVGDSKSFCFDRAIGLQRRGAIRSLGLVDAEPATYDKTFKGTDLTDADFEVARKSNLWRIGLAGENAWLLLTFVNDALIHVERKEYRGPTE